MLTEQLLDRLSATWRAHGAPIEDGLAAGRTVESFTSDDGTLHVDLPDELQMWWAWHDGRIQQEGRDIRASYMGPLLRPYTSTRAREWWQRMMVEATDAAADGPEGTPLADPRHWWREAWVPLFNDGTGDLVADCEIGPAGVTPIRRIEWGLDDDPPPPPATDSLGQLVEWWIEAIELAIWAWDNDRGMWVRALWDREIRQRYGLLI
jgi:cell wall assembly regulator SMI1